MYIYIYELVLVKAHAIYTYVYIAILRRVPPLRTLQKQHVRKRRIGK
jgi:hypothetical protein